MDNPSNKNLLLILAALCSGIAALAHIGCIVFGGDWYRFFGAGEQMALLSEQGSLYPAAVTSVIVMILLLWSLYALSGARIIVKLPLLRLGLCTISLVYIARGLAFIWLMPLFPENSLTFWLVSSGICLFIGALYAVGTYQVWPQLKSNKA